MAQARFQAADTPGTWFTGGKDHKQPVRFLIRPIPIEVDRKLHRETYGNAKVRQLGRQSASTAIERAQEYTIARAAYALLDTENFSIEVVDPLAAEALGKLLGTKIDAGAEVLLDGKWSDELRRQVLSVARRRAAWISNKADEITEAEVEDEEEEGADF